MPELSERPEPCEERAVHPEVALLAVPADLSTLEGMSSFSHLRRVTAWMHLFTLSCCTKKRNETPVKEVLTTKELKAAEEYWIATVQHTAFSEEIFAIKGGDELHSGRLIMLHPFLDCYQLLCVGGRQNLSSRTYDRCHSIILPGGSQLTKLIVRGEHLRLLHAVPTLVTASLVHCFHILGGCRVVRTVTRSCVICHRTAGKSHPTAPGTTTS